MDEAYLDVSHKTLGEAERLAVKIKSEIEQEENLTCSIGIATNKTVAKVASDFRKPDGLTIVESGTERKFLSNLSIRELPGVGQKAEKVLKGKGIRKIGDLATADPGYLEKRLGKWGLSIYKKAHGEGSVDVREKRVVKSISKETTFQEDTYNADFVFSVIRDLAKRVHNRMLRKGKKCRTIGVKVRFEDFETHTKEKSFRVATDSFELMERTARNLAEAFTGVNKIRLVGVKVSNLEEQSGLRQEPLVGYFSD